jgi:hypothetical protein
MTKIEILHETAKHYNLSNRSVDSERCLYVGPNNKQCAFARCCVNPLKEWDGHGGVNSLVNRFGKDNVDNLLKPEYHGHKIEFWIKVQRLHDVLHYWNEDGLSEQGREEYNKLLKLYTND